MTYGIMQEPLEKPHPKLYLQPDNKSFGPKITALQLPDYPAANKILYNLERLSFSHFYRIIVINKDAPPSEWEKGRKRIKTLTTRALNTLIRHYDKTHNCRTEWEGFNDAKALESASSIINNGMVKKVRNCGPKTLLEICAFAEISPPPTIKQIGDSNPKYIANCIHYLTKHGYKVTPPK